MALYTIPTSKFNLTAGSGKTLLCEASDVAPVGKLRFFKLDTAGGRVGLKVVSPKTGKPAVFALFRVHRTEDGELAWWDLAPTPETLVKTPALAGWTLRVFKD